MRALAAGAIALTMLQGGAASFEIPASIMGNWETSADNCTANHASSGLSASFKTEGGEHIMSFVDWSTEGGDCLIGGLMPVGTELVLMARCRWEENERSDASLIYLAVSPDGQTMTLQTDAQRKAGVRDTYQKCPEVSAATPPANKDCRFYAERSDRSLRLNRGEGVALLQSGMDVRRCSIIPALSDGVSPLDCGDKVLSLRPLGQSDTTYEVDGELFTRACSEDRETEWPEGDEAARIEAEEEARRLAEDGAEGGEMQPGFNLNPTESQNVF